MSESTATAVAPEEGGPWVTQTHLCQSVTGPLRNWKHADWRSALGWTRRDDGTKFASVEELKGAFLDELAMGHEVIPVGKPCEGFDYKTGCPGHRVRATETPAGAA